MIRDVLLERQHLQLGIKRKESNFNEFIMYRELGLKIFKENLKPVDTTQPKFLERTIIQILQEIEHERFGNIF